MANDLAHFASCILPPRERLYPFYGLFVTADELKRQVANYWAQRNMSSAELATRFGYDFA